MATPILLMQKWVIRDVVFSMPGDLLRAKKHIAETFLEDVREVNNVRGMLGFLTGLTKAVRSP